MPGKTGITIWLSINWNDFTELSVSSLYVINYIYTFLDNELTSVKSLCDKLYLYIPW